MQATSLNGKVIAVTGAGRGIGREIALLCGRLGAAVVVNDYGGPEGAATPAREVVDEILGLKALGLRSVLLLPLGYRATEGDWLVNLQKVRRSTADFVIRR